MKQTISITFLDTSSAKVLTGRRLFLICFFLLCIHHLQAQESDSERLKNIDRQLSYLAETSAPGLKETANFSVTNSPIQELLRGVAETHNLNVSVDPGISAKVTNNFNNVEVKDLLFFICKEYNLGIRFVNSIMSFFPFSPPAPQAQPYIEKKLPIKYEKENNLLTVRLSRDSLTHFARQLTEVSGKNVIIAPGLDEKLTSGYIQEATFEEGLDKLAFANGLSMRKTEDGFYIIEPADPSNIAIQETQAQPSNQLRRPRNRPNVESVPTQKNAPASGEGFYMEVDSTTQETLITIEAENTPIAAIIEDVSLSLDKNYVLLADVQGLVTGNVKRISYDALLTYLLQATPYTYKKQEGIYIIGERNQEGLRSSQLIRLQFRTVENIEEVIPAEMKKGVEVKVFKDLNSIILSGARPQIEEISTFINAIDQLVPNILIEVIVVDIRKGFSVQTGIKAFLSDSVPKTSGQVFPGIDVTLNPNSVNRFLSQLDDKGVINLGKVTPSFYVTLQALEQNNNINIRSTPKLSTLNGHEANLSIGQSRYFLEQTQNISGGVTPINTVTQRYNRVEANLSIKINPMVAGDEHITLNIEAEFSDFIEPEQEGFPPGNATRKFVSQIRVRNEEMIVLGGLEEARKSQTGSGTPILSRIPVLKWLFSSRSKEKVDNRLVVFIKPTIVY